MIVGQGIMDYDDGFCISKFDMPLIIGKRGPQCLKI